MNRGFLSAFLHEDKPCFALAIVEVEGTRCALITLRLSEQIPRSVSGDNFEFGHALLGSRSSSVVHLAFVFHEFTIFHALLNPRNSIVRAVLQLMADTQKYMFFALDDQNGAVALHAPMGQENAAHLKSTLAHLKKCQTTETQYRLALRRFSSDPQPPGLMLNWVCRDDIDALHPERDPLVLRSA